MDHEKARKEDRSLRAVLGVVVLCFCIAMAAVIVLAGKMVYLHSSELLFLAGGTGRNFTILR